MFITVLPIFFPVLAGLAMLDLKIESRKARERYVLTVLAIALALTLVVNFCFGGSRLTLCTFAGGLKIAFDTDKTAVFFTTVFSTVWLLVGVYSFEYLEHDREQNRFFAYYIASLGALLGVAYADNLVTLYSMFEAMSLLSYVLVIHERKPLSFTAGRKYIYYSLAGASLGLIAIFYFYRTGWDMSFVPGGTAPTGAQATPTLLIMVILSVVGFGCKAGMFPLHAWLPTAHPQAPAPASSVLSGLITKAGIIAIIRIVYFTVGADLLRGTFAQYVLLILSLLTIFMGSMLAYKEKIIKKRLAYSTVSNVSYVIFGLMLLNRRGIVGALLQVVFHALAKNVLFLCAGSFIHRTGKTNVADMTGMGYAMPKTMTCFSIAGLSLVGVPMTEGFVAKWYLAQGALTKGSFDTANMLGFVGICVIMVSALLTAGYLVSVTAKAFFANRSETSAERCESGNKMIIPIAVLTAAVLIFGIYPAPVISRATAIAESIIL